MSTIFRPAVKSDNATIRTIVRRAGINPFGLHWSRFLVAENGEKIAGVGQIKIHRDGSRELASIAVQNEFRGQGIGTEIVKKLLEQEDGTLYLTCRLEMANFYSRFGFTIVEGHDLTPYFARLHRLGAVISRLGSFFGRDDLSFLIMKR